MPLAVSDKIEEQDYDPLFYIQYTAFSNEPAIIALYPGGLDPSARAKNVERFKYGLGFTDPQVSAAKVVDGSTGEICAFLTMRLYDKNPFVGRGSSDIHLPDVDMKLRPWLEWFFNSKTDRKQEISELQEPGSYADLVAVGTHPARRREGAAALLLKWALGLADEKGMRTYLDASKEAVGYGLYEKRGFRAVDTHTYVDKKRFPNADVVSLVTMVRDPKGV